MQIRFARTKNQVQKCFGIMRQLRPHLEGGTFLARVKRQQRDSGYQLVFLEEDGKVRAVAGFRIQEMLSRGLHMYVDDLVTDEEVRSRGYGGRLFDCLVDYARSKGCGRLDLDSGIERKRAHQFYKKKGMRIRAYHFAIDLGEP